MTDEVKLKAQGLGMTEKKISDEVELFLSVNGENICVRALEMADANMRKIARTGLHPGTALKSWRWATRKIVADEERNEIQRRLDEEKAASEEAYKATIQKGYVPNKETILAQLEQLYADSEISIQQYRWGVRGLDIVHGFVEAAQAEDEVELDLGF
jgi:hypothetical protein